LVSVGDGEDRDGKHHDDSDEWTTPVSTNDGRS
jgi:hypothetical protein